MKTLHIEKSFVIGLILNQTIVIQLKHLALKFSAFYFTGKNKNILFNQTYKKSMLLDIFYNDAFDHLGKLSLARRRQLS